MLREPSRCYGLVQNYFKVDISVTNCYLHISFEDKRMLDKLFEKSEFNLIEINGKYLIILTQDTYNKYKVKQREAKLKRILHDNS